MPQITTETIDQKSFYKHFKFGIELEMETRLNPMLDSLLNNKFPRPTNLKFISDGSLRQTNPNGFLTELISKNPIKSQEQEKEFFTDMKEVLPTFKSASGEDIFSLYNTSASTHFHFSFQKKSDDILWIFDCIEFEQFFFKKYMTTFKSEKFLDRINSKFCKAPSLRSADGMEKTPHKIRQDLNKIDLSEYSNEERKTEGRYRWLNMKSVADGTGAEIRVFPFLQTYSGVAITTKFMQDLIMEYYLKPSTKEKLKLIEIYEKHIKTKQIKISKLNNLKKIIYTVLNNTSTPSGEVRMLLAKWVQKQPSLVIKNELSF